MTQQLQSEFNKIVNLWCFVNVTYYVIYILRSHIGEKKLTETKHIRLKGREKTSYFLLPLCVLVLS